MRRLFEFPHSHYCEIARWALALKQLEYRSSPILPGWHSYRIKKLAPQSSVPVLCDAGAVI